MSLSDWLKKQPAWIQKAYVMLVTKNIMDDGDISELVDLCINEADESPDIPITQIPANIIAPTHPHTLRLCSIGEIQGINALAPRKPLDFGQGNLTVIYGDTASGKSGYVRILKHACGAREKGNLYGNVFSKDQEQQKCKICYQIDNSEVIPCDWDASKGCMKDFQSVNIYDTHCGKVYVEGKPEVDYEPPELLIFSSLINVCHEVAAIIERKIQDISTSEISVLPDKYTKTIYGQWYSGITSQTTTTEIENKCKWYKKDEHKETELHQRLSEKNPKERAKQIRIQKTYLDQLITDTKSCLNKLSEVSCKKYFEFKNDAKEKKRVVESFAKKVFSKAPIKDGIGSDTWKILWETAREYSEKYVYKDKIFPFTDKNARCVLCQQILLEEARNRMVSFEKYVKGEVQKASILSKKKLEDAIKDIGEIQSKESVKTKLHASGISEEADILSVINLYEEFRERKKQIQEVESIDNLKPLTDTQVLLNRLSEISTQYEKSATSFESDATNDNRPEIEVELCELQAQKWVSEQKKKILAETERLNRIDILEKAKKLTNTTNISKENSRRSKQLITESLIGRFNDELKTLGASKIKVKLVREKANKEQIPHSIQLYKDNEEIENKTTTSEKTQEILSEGEQRIVSLAAFIADVMGKPHNTSFVFDDPISSLDHTFEEQVAKRLVKLSKDRQVIVFTHRLSLLGLIEDYGKKEKREPHVKCVRKESWGTGEPEVTTLREQSFAQALNTLNEELRDARNIYNTEGITPYEKKAGWLYKEIRILLEHIIEKDLLADVIKRHRRKITTDGKIEKLACITIDDCRFLDAMMSEYSRYEHSQSDGAPISPPEPDILDENLRKLKDWHDGFVKRQKGGREKKSGEIKKEELYFSKPLSVLLFGRAAAQTDGICIDLEVHQPEKIELIAERAVLVTSDTMDPVVRPGQYVLLIQVKNVFNDGDLVAVALDNKKLLRRIWRQDNKYALLEVINPLKKIQAHIIDIEELQLWKIIGVLFEPKGNKFYFGFDEWDPNNTINLGNINKMKAIMVEGNSIDPVARDGQYVLIKETIHFDSVKENMLAVVETAEDGRLIKRINLVEGNESIILTSINLVEPHKPISINKVEVINNYPLVGVLFEVTTLEN